MTEKTAPAKAPNEELVQRAELKADAGDDLNAREAKALEDQRVIDEERGYRKILWKPGVWLLQHLATQHTILDGEGAEAEMRRVHNEYLLGQAR